MSAVWTGTVVASVVFAGGMAGLCLHRFLPERHLAKETADVVRLGMGMISVLASLVLGLLIATAKSSFDNTDQSIRNYSANLILLAETLRDYGDTAAEPRALLRRYTAMAIEDNWPQNGNLAPIVEDRAAGTLLEHVREAIRALHPVDAGQKWLQDQALQIHSSLLQQRWLLIEHAGETISPVILGVLVGWIALIFASFGFNAPRNGTVIAAFLVSAIAIGAAIFLIMEMDAPFTGLLHVSSMPMRNALAHMIP